MAVSSDTIMRCSYCDHPVLMKEISEGGCPRCGSRKVKIAFGVTDQEMDDLRSRGYEPSPERWSDKPWPVSNAA